MVHRNTSLLWRNPPRRAKCSPLTLSEAEAARSYRTGERQHFDRYLVVGFAHARTWRGRSPERPHAGSGSLRRAAIRRSRDVRNPSGLPEIGQGSASKPGNRPAANATASRKSVEIAMDRHSRVTFCRHHHRRQDHHTCAYAIRYFPASPLFGGNAAIEKQHVLFGEGADMSVWIGNQSAISCFFFVKASTNPNSPATIPVP